MNSLLASQSDGSPFAELGLDTPLLQALENEGYSLPTPIQTEAIPHALEGHDLLATARTGSGKTAAFLLPLIQRLGAIAERGPVRILVLSPTRELAQQIAERADAYGKELGLRHAAVYGGVSQRSQERALKQHPPLLVATPGRLLDLVQQRVVRLGEVEMVVLDEADRMLDMGFLPDIRRIFGKLPAQRQTLMFSATMPADIERLSESILDDPVRVSVDTPEQIPTELEQGVCFVPNARKSERLKDLLGADDVSRALVFTRTKRGADRLAGRLAKAGLEAEAIHGDRSQKERDEALEGFREGSTSVLVATDVAARGIDVKDISHVVNYELPDSPESYMHRIGRTGRAGAGGKAISLCDATERALLYDIERQLGVRIPDMDEANRTNGSEPLEQPNKRPEPKTFGTSTVRKRRGRGRRL